MPTKDKHVKLDSGQKHLLRLIRRDCHTDGWTTVSEKVLPLVEMLPSQLVRIGPLGAQLTPEGSSVVSAMDWLE